MYGRETSDILKFYVYFRLINLPVFKNKNQRSILEIQLYESIDM